MKKPLNYYGYAFEDPYKYYNKVYLKTKKGKKEVKKHIKSNKKLQKQLKKNGFDSSECWNLDNTIISFTLPRLKHYRKKLVGYPAQLESQEEWEQILDAIIWSFEQHQEDYESAPNFTTNKEEYDKYQTKVTLGFTYFGKYLTNLWS